ncbi:hypothetical protein FBULB1_14264 [Fusarium bulbicola]|nr:hypothetical protein FBULB1_14264 [Fusarium bulbicola]
MAYTTFLFMLVLRPLGPTRKKTTENAFACMLQFAMGPAGGVGVGRCNSHKSKLNRWWTDARKLVDAALLYAQDDSVDGPEYVYTFFALDPPPSDAEYRAQARARLLLVKRFIDGDLQLPTGKPWLFCSSKWLERDRFTGDGAKKLMDEADDYCSKKVDRVPQNFGATHEGETWIAVTICVQNLGWNSKTENLRLGSIQTEGKSIVDYRAKSMTLFHELFHVVLGNEKTQEHEKSDDLKYIANPRKEEGEDPGDEDQDSISTQEALYNPESYTITRSKLKKTEDLKDKDKNNGGSEGAGCRKRLLRV